MKDTATIAREREAKERRITACKMIGFSVAMLVVFTVLAALQ